MQIERCTIQKRNNWLDRLDNQLFKVKYALNLQTYWDLNFTNHIHFQPLKVVRCGSETQLQVTENLHWIY